MNHERNGSAVMCLNGKPTFFHGLLDQGYFSDGIFLPATEQGFRDDILRMKACGFNMLRKHIKLEGHAFNLDKTYGYRQYTDRESFEQGLHALYRNEILPAIGQGLCATVYTQVSDVEDETNGLLTYDRRVLKVDEGGMRQLADALYTTFDEKFAK